MFNMKKLLAVVVLCQFVVAVYPYCFQDDQADCEPNFSGVIDCHDCDCSSDGTQLNCCFNIEIPGKMTEGCVAEFDEDLCEYHVYKPNSPDTECLVYSATGR